MPQSEKGRSQPLTSEPLDTEVTQRQTSGYKWVQMDVPAVTGAELLVPSQQESGSRWELERSVLPPVRPWWAAAEPGV